MGASAKRQKLNASLTASVPLNGMLMFYEQYDMKVRLETCFVTVREIQTFR